MILIDGEEVKPGNVYIVNNLLFECTKIYTVENKRYELAANLRHKFFKNYYLYISVYKDTFMVNKYAFFVKRLKPQAYLISEWFSYDTLEGLMHVYNELKKLSEVRLKNRLENIDKMLEDLQTIKDQYIIKDILE